MSFMLTTYHDVKKYIKTCSSKRLEKIQMDIQCLLYERDYKKMNRKATHKKVKQSNYGGTD